VTSLVVVLDGVARGELPPNDMGMTHVPQPSTRDAAVLATTGHVIVAADVDSRWLALHYPHGEPGEAFNPRFLGALEAVTGRRVNNIDIMLIAAPRPGPLGLLLSAVHDHTHPRVRRASRYRDDVTAFTCEGGVLAIGRGLAGRWEVGLEVDPAYRGRGLGRAMAEAAAHLSPDGAPMWAQIAPGNAASLRAFLAAGYRPVGQEALLVTHRGEMA
jgi:GNAT superfamily N-acetyltransferase